MEQESVSRIERRADLLLSTMRKYVAAMGGDLKLIAEFPDRSPIQIDTLGALSEREAPVETKRNHTKNDRFTPSPTERCRASLVENRSDATPVYTLSHRRKFGLRTAGPIGLINVLRAHGHMPI
ncbi:MAG: hypothetical protein KGM97_10715 [Alphaproteobacteria bacterium]|nr:hypothetical protein [Alphaproteobacteria bacterium]MDE2631448.1 hypothetical protein [Alphaproteobacteria bacterium]